MSDVIKIKAPPWHDNWALQWAVLLMLFFVSFLLWNLSPELDYWTPHPSLQALYSQLSQHLANGLGFVLPNNNPYAAAAEHTAPLYPLITAGISALFDQSVEASRDILLWFQFFLLCLCILLTFLFGRVRIKSAFALLLAGWVAISPNLWGAAKGLAPQLLFLTCSLMALTVIDKYFNATGDKIKPGQILHCSFWVTACVLTNISQGLLLMVAFVTITFFKLGLRRGMNVTLGMLLVLSPWVLWSLSRHPEVLTQSFQQLQATFWPSTNALNASDGDTAQSLIGVKHLGSSISWLLAHGVHGLFGDVYLNALPVIGKELPEAGLTWAALSPIRWLFGSLVFIGVVAGFSQFSGVASGYMVLSIIGAIAGFQLEILASPILLPLVGFYLLVGLKWLLQGLKEVQLQPLGMAGISASTILICLHCITVLGVAINQPKQDAELTRQTWQHATRWLKTATSTNAAIATSQPDLIRLFAERPALKHLPYMDANLISSERNITQYLMAKAEQPNLGRWFLDNTPLVYQQQNIRIWKID